MSKPILILIIFISAVYVLKLLLNNLVFEKKRKQRQEFYRNVYLKSDDWQRKRYVVLQRDKWQCVYCGARATQVHHKRYARINIGREPIKWLVSVCQPCHEKLHDQGEKEIMDASKPRLESHAKQWDDTKTSLPTKKILKPEVPDMQEWLKANPTKGVNDYFIKFGK
jgi:hypothetical protein